MADIGLTDDMRALQYALANWWTKYLIDFERSAMRYVPIFYLQWMFVFQQFYMATFASRTRRIMKFF
jgi:hypothetical protein